jgi:hypothetical protein
MQENNWENYAPDLYRIKVEGGFIYGFDQGICFVPDVDLTRYQAHLRDAYMKGYTDGHEDAKKGIDDRNLQD